MFNPNSGSYNPNNNPDSTAQNPNQSPNQPRTSAETREMFRRLSQPQQAPQSPNTGRARAEQVQGLKGQVGKNIRQRVFIPMFVAGMTTLAFAGIAAKSKNDQPPVNVQTISAEAFSDNTADETLAIDPSLANEDVGAKIGATPRDAIGETQETANPYAGELENGVHYDYSEYADRANKESYNAYGYDCSNLYGDEAGLKAKLIDVVNKVPEILASRTKLCLQDVEKSAIGIDPSSSYEQIDEKLNGADGGALQSNMIAHLTEDINSPYAKISFNLRTGTDYTLYNYTDATNDTEMTPLTNHIGYDVKERYEAPQATLYLPVIDYIDENGQKHYKTYIDQDGNEQVELFEAMTVNLKCGGGGQETFKTQEGVAGVLKITSDSDSHHNDGGGGGNNGGGNNGGGNNGGGNNGGGNNSGNNSGGSSTSQTNTSTTPEPKNQTVASKNSGAVTPEGQTQPVTSEPAPDAYAYNSGTNTYDAPPSEQSNNIGYEVAQEPAPASAPAEQPALEQPNNFDASATVGTGEVTGNTASADGSGDIEGNLNKATGSPENPAGDYSEGF